MTPHNDNLSDIIKYYYHTQMFMVQILVSEEMWKENWEHVLDLYKLFKVVKLQAYIADKVKAR